MTNMYIKSRESEYWGFRGARQRSVLGGNWMIPPSIRFQRSSMTGWAVLGCINDQAVHGQLETFGSDAEISIKRTAGDARDDRLEA
jgi:hypothetical protein